MASPPADLGGRAAAERQDPCPIPVEPLVCPDRKAKPGHDVILPPGIRRNEVLMQYVVLAQVCRPGRGRSSSVSTVPVNIPARGDKLLPFSLRSASSKSTHKASAAAAPYDMTQPAAELGSGTKRAPNQNYWRHKISSSMITY